MRFEDETAKLQFEMYEEKILDLEKKIKVVKEQIVSFNILF